MFKSLFAIGSHKYSIRQSLKYIFSIRLFFLLFILCPQIRMRFSLSIHPSIHSSTYLSTCLLACLAACLTWQLLFIVLSDADDADDDDEADEGDSSTFPTYLMAILVISGVVAFAVVGAAMVIVLRKRRQRAALSMSRGTAESSTGSV